MAAVELLPDEFWAEVEPLLPPPPPPSRKGGRPPACNRRALSGVVFVLRSGCQWQMLPKSASGVSGSTCWRRFAEWTASGVWAEVHLRLLARLNKLGGIDTSKAVVDSQAVRAVKGGRTPGRTRPTAASRAASGTR